MSVDPKQDDRKGYCPVYDLKCPAGQDASEACEMRFQGDYNPLTSFRDAEIEHCAIYRQEQAQETAGPSKPGDPKE